MKKQNPKQENAFVNLLLNIAIPTFVLMKLSGDSYLGAKWGLIVALAFPICYGIYDYSRAEKVNFFSVVGFISILLTGGFSLLKLDPQYIVIKETAIPAIFGIATLISIVTPYPLVKTIIYKSGVMDIDRVTQQLQLRQTEKAFSNTLAVATIIVAISFFISALLNYILATMILVGQPGTEIFNEQLGKLTGLSFLVIGLPSMVVLISLFFFILWKISRLTGLKLDEIVTDVHDHANHEKTEG